MPSGRAVGGAGVLYCSLGGAGKSMIKAGSSTAGRPRVGVIVAVVVGVTVTVNVGEGVGVSVTVIVDVGVISVVAGMVGVGVGVSGTSQLSVVWQREHCPGL